MTEYGTITSVTNSRKEQFIYNPSNSNSSGSKIVTITCKWEERDTYTPAAFTAFSSGSAFILTNVERAQMPAGLCQITLTYTATSSSDSVPVTTYVEQSTQMEVDIREHPNFDDWADDWDEDAQAFLPSSDKYGIKSYIRGSTSVTVTEFSTGQPDSAKDDIGKLASPGAGYGDSSHWLLVGANRSKQGLYWAMAKTYLYSAEEYNSDIYS